MTEVQANAFCHPFGGGGEHPEGAVLQLCGGEAAPPWAQSVSSGSEYPSHLGDIWAWYLWLHWRDSCLEHSQLSVTETGNENEKFVDDNSVDLSFFLIQVKNSSINGMDTFHRNKGF